MKMRKLRLRQSKLLAQDHSLGSGSELPESGNSGYVRDLENHELFEGEGLTEATELTGQC